MASIEFMIADRIPPRLKDIAHVAIGYQHGWPVTRANHGFKETGFDVEAEGQARARDELPNQPFELRVIVRQCLFGLRPATLLSKARG